MSISSLQEALKLHQAGDLAQAEKLYQAILTEQPGNAEVLHLLGILYAQQQNYKQALSFIEQAITYDAKEPTFYNSLGNTQKSLGDVSAAIDAYEKALQLNPRYAVAHNNLGNLYYQRGKFDVAKKHYLNAIELKPDYVDAYYNLATLLAKIQYFSEAINYLKKTIELQPKHALAQGQLGQLLQQEGQLNAAIAHYEACLALEPNHTEISQLLATALIKQGRLLEAEKYLLKTLQLDSKHPEALYNLGTIYLIIGKPNEALRYFLQLLSIKPEPEIYYNIGVIYMHQDRLDDAIDFFSEAVKHRKDYLDAYLNLGATFLKKGDYNNATNYYQKALALKPNDPEISYLLSALMQKNTPAAAPPEYLRNLFDEYAPYFDTHLQQQLAYQVPQLIAQTVFEETAHETAKWKILDLGCGTGLIGQALKKLAAQLIGIDIAPKMIEQARPKEIYDELEVADIVDALKKYQALDLIVAGDVFTYVGDLAKIFKLAKVALKPQAWFVFTVEKGHEYPFHLQTNARYTHSKQYITELAEQNKFQIQAIKLATLRMQQNEPVTGYVVVLRNK